MDDLIDDELFLQIEEHLKSSEQSWLLGAGVIPPLITKVKSRELCS